MAKIEFENYSFYYPESKNKAINNVSLSIEEGEFVLLGGPSGSGKTTLLKQLKKEIMPEGQKEGSIFYDNKPILEIDDLTAVKDIGMVFQDVHSQTVTDKVYRELVFSMENLGYPVNTMRRRVGELSSYFGLEELLYESIDNLSGGQKQILNLASVLILQPKVLLLDEPTSQLDPVSTKDFLEIINRLNKEFSMTIVITEHRFEEIFPMVDRVVLMDKGEITYNGKPKEVSKKIYTQKDKRFFNYLPSLAKLYFTYEKENSKIKEIPLTVKEGKEWIKDKEFENKDINENYEVQKDVLMKLKNISFKYERDKPYILRQLDFNIYRGESLSILGGNGAGKSTLLKIMAHILKPQYGRINYDKALSIGYLAQNPMIYFTHESVMDELVAAGKDYDLSKIEIEEIIEFFSLENILSRHPYDISGGEKQLVALATVLMGKPDLFFLDEPTKGLDPLYKKRIGEIINSLIEKGKTVTIATHDIEFAAKYSNRCALLFDGDIATADIPEIFFSENYFYTTTINRVVRNKKPLAITFEDVIGNGNY